MAAKTTSKWAIVGMAGGAMLLLWGVWYFFFRDEQLTPGNASYQGPDKEGMDVSDTPGRTEDNTAAAMVQPGRNVTVVDGQQLDRSGCTRLVVCPKTGRTFTVSGACWYVNSIQDGWVCAGLAPGREPFRIDIGNGQTVLVTPMKD